jgi:hypothetical protein
MALEDIVNVNVTKTTRTVSQVGFGTPLVYAYHNKFAARVRKYKKSTWSSAMVSDGFTANDAAYLGMKAVFAQSPSPKEAKLGRKSTAPTKVCRLTPVVGGTTFVHEATIEDNDGTEYSITYTEDGTPTVAEICTGIAAAINATAVGVTASGSSGTFVALTADVAGADFSVYSMSSTLTLTEVTTTTGDATDLDAIWAADRDFYAVYPAFTAPTIIEAVADWAAAKPVIHISSTHDMSCLDATITVDIMSSMKAQAYPRSAVLYSSRARQHAGAAWIGSRLSYVPGKATWKFATLAGVTVDALTDTQTQAVLDKHGNYYTEEGGLNVVTEGWTGAGEFIDVTQVSDWWSARLKEAVFGKLASVPKLPFDFRGKASLRGAIANVYKQGVANDAFLDQDPVIDIPDPEELPDADKAARNWSGITTTAYLSNAVHKVDAINAYLS